MFASYFNMFAAYNRWANRRLFDAAAELSEQQFMEDRGVYFRSLCGTLNHLLVTDLIWSQRVSGDGAVPDRLDAVLHRELRALRAAREQLDAHIVEILKGLDDARLQGLIRYRRVTSPEVQEQPLRDALAHWFNHQTHHRGQAHAVLTGLTGKAPELDLLYFQRANQPS